MLVLLRSFFCLGWSFVCFFVEVKIFYFFENFYFFKIFIF